jgi:hypothetical protein
LRVAIVLYEMLNARAYLHLRYGSTKPFTR